MKQDGKAVISDRAIAGLKELARKSQDVALPRIMDEFAKEVVLQHTRNIKAGVTEDGSAQKRNETKTTRQKKSKMPASLAVRSLIGYERILINAKKYRVDKLEGHGRLIRLPQARRRIVKYLREKGYKYFQEPLSNIKGKPLSRYKVLLISRQMRRVIKELRGG